jgi:hypothetical protein
MRVAILVALALVLPASAVAKEATRLDVCGPAKCARLTDRASLDAFMRGGEMASAAPSGAQRSYLLKAYMRDDTGKSIQGWTSHWLPAAGLVASEDAPGHYNFSPVGAKLERALRGAIRGQTARSARRFPEAVEPVAQVDEVVRPAATARAGSDDGGGLPTLAWLGVAAGLLAVGGAGAVGMRRR